MQSIYKFIRTKSNGVWKIAKKTSENLHAVLGFVAFSLRYSCKGVFRKKTISDNCKGHFFKTEENLSSHITPALA
jgi:hypothetical protein